MHVENQTNPDKEETFCALGTFVILQLKYDSMQKKRWNEIEGSCDYIKKVLFRFMSPQEETMRHRMRQHIFLPNHCQESRKINLQWWQW